MPHFVLDCSEGVLTLQSPAKVISEVHDTAEATGLFKPGDIKVRINPYRLYTVGTTQNHFIHVSGHIMEGRTTVQRLDLSQRIVAKLKSMFPDVPVISMNVEEFEKATYCNRNLI